MRAWGIVACLLLCTIARADDKETAKKHYTTGMAAYELEHYDTAIKEFESVYLTVPDPASLFNLGQCYRLSNRPQQAIGFYQKYLRKAGERVPKPQRAEVEEQIAKLTRFVEENKRSSSLAQLDGQEPPAKAPAPSPSTGKPAAPAPSAAKAPAVVKPKNIRAEELDGQVLEHPDPHLPSAAKILNEGATEQTFVGKVCLDQKGGVARVDVIQGILAADDEIVSTIRKWRYKPQAQPVCFVTRIAFDFRQ